MARGEILTGEVAAPTIGEIIENVADIQQREADPFFALRYPRLDRQDDIVPRIKVLATTEAAAVQDFRDTMQIVSELYSEYGQDPWDVSRARHAGKLSTDLYFIGRREFATGVDSIARHWLDRISSSPSGELFVGLEKEGSSALVSSEVISRLKELDADAAAQVVPFLFEKAPLYDEQTLHRMRSAGIALADDWSISGQQMRSILGTLAESVDPENVEVNLICATDRHLRDGMGGGSRVPVFSHYVRPFTDHEGDESVSVTGAHSDTDYGFGLPIETLFRNLKNIRNGTRPRTESPDLTLPDACSARGGVTGPELAKILPYPLLRLVPRAYMPLDKSVLQGLETPDRDELLRQQERCAEYAARVLSPTTPTKKTSLHVDAATHSKIFAPGPSVENEMLPLPDLSKVDMRDVIAKYSQLFENTIIPPEPSLLNLPTFSMPNLGSYESFGIMIAGVVPEHKPLPSNEKHMSYEYGSSELLTGPHGNYNYESTEIELTSPHTTPLFEVESSVLSSFGAHILFNLYREENQGELEHTKEPPIV